MDRRSFMKMIGITLSSSLLSAIPASTFPRTRFYLNGQLFRDFPKDFAREDEQDTEEFLTESFKEHREFEKQYAECTESISHASLGHGNIWPLPKWSGDALFTRKVGEADFYYNDSDLTLIDGKIWLVGASE